MKKRLSGLLFIFAQIFLFTMDGARAQTPTEVKPVSAGSRITVENDSYLVAKDFFDFIISDHKRLTELEQLYSARVAVADSVARLRLHIVDLNTALLKIQQEGIRDYRELMKESILLNQEALEEIRTARMRSFLNASAIGFGFGGIAAGAREKGEFQFNWLGAIAGLVLGNGVNYGLNKLF